AAAFIALRSAVPDRSVSAAEVIFLTIAVIGSLLLTQLEAAKGFASGGILSFDPTSLARTIGLAAMPCLALFWAARRGAPSCPQVTGAMIGLAGWCFSIAAGRLLFQFVEVANSLASQTVYGVLLVALSAAVGAAWLDPGLAWHIRHPAAGGALNSWTIDSRVLFPAAMAASLGLTIFALSAGRLQVAPIPDFDRAIASYEQSLNDFRPNVPSGSLEAVLTAYIEHGMAPYMWDFGPQGFKLVGGRIDRLADGTPVAYTWFRGSRGGVMCLMRPTAAFQPPAATHEENQHIFFYRYHGFSVAMLNVGGYGSFISVIVAPVPMKAFMPMILSAVH
ncbi:MAG: hypothetical protein ACREQC_09090, partial [Candidatus Binataceae bacterium]